jgi:CheY-like chemotaxis protein
MNSELAPKIVSGRNMAEPEGQTRVADEGVSLVQDSQSSGNVLIAEPDLANLRLVANIIEEEGFTAVMTGDGREAFQLLQTNPNFVAGIFEVVMPHMSGPDLVRLMKQDEILKCIPVIMMTPRSRFSFDIFAAGAEVLLPKPFKTTQLTNLLLMLIEKAATKAAGS